VVGTAKSEKRRPPRRGVNRREEGRGEEVIQKRNRTNEYGRRGKSEGPVWRKKTKKTEERRGSTFVESELTKGGMSTDIKVTALKAETNARSLKSHVEG